MTRKLRDDVRVFIEDDMLLDFTEQDVRKIDRSTLVLVRLVVCSVM